MRQVPVTAEHRGVAGAVTGAVPMITFGLAAAQQWTHWPGFGLAAVILFAAAITAVVIVAVTTDSRLSALCGVWGLGMAGWLLTVQAAGPRGGPWHPGAVVRLGALSALLGAGTLLCYARYHAAAQAGGLAARRKVSEAERVRWNTVIARAGNFRGVECVEVRDRRDATDVFYRLTDPAVTPEDLQARSRNILVALAPAGYRGVLIEEAGAPHEIVMRLTRAAAKLAADFPFPAIAELERNGAITVNKPLLVGFRPDGNPVYASLRETAAMIIGVTRSGKSNALNVLLALLSRCPDVIVWVIDMKGRLAGPWLTPYAEGDSPAPYPDWVATTRDEAWRMLSDLALVREVRSGSLRGGSMMVPDADHPQVVLIFDECSNLLSPNVARERQGGQHSNVDFAALTGELAKIWLSEAIVPVLANQRAVMTDFGGPDVKSQTSLRWVLACSSPHEAHQVIEDDPAAVKMLLSLGAQGGGLMWQGFGNVKPFPFKWMRLDPALDKPHGTRDLNRIHEYARAYDGRSLEPEVTAALQHYRDRWNPDRCPVLGKVIAGSPRARQYAAQVAEQQAGAVAVAEREQRHAREQRHRDDLAEFERMISGDDWGGTAFARPSTTEDLIVALLADPPTGAGRLGGSAAELALWLRDRGRPLSRSQLHRTLARMRAAGTLEVFPPEAEGTIHSRWRPVRPGP